MEASNWNSSTFGKRLRDKLSKYTTNHFCVFTKNLMAKNSFETKRIPSKRNTAHRPVCNFQIRPLVIRLVRDLLVAQNRQYLRPEYTTSRKSSQEHIGLWHWGTIIAIDSIVTKILLRATVLPTKSHVWIETAILEGPNFQLHDYIKGDLRSNESLASEVPSQYQSPLKVSRFLVGDPPSVEGVHPNV